MFIYLGVAIFGYLSMLENTPKLIIDRTPLPGSGNYFMICGRLEIMFNLLTSIPL